MLRYYSYYSVGGYKDFFLGDSDNKAENTYYIITKKVFLV